MTERSAAAQQALLRARRRQMVLANAADRMTRVGGSAMDVPTDDTPAAERAAPAAAPAAPVSPASGSGTSADVASAFDDTDLKRMQQQLLRQQPQLLQQLQQQQQQQQQQVQPTSASLLPAQAGSWLAVGAGLLSGVAHVYFHVDLDHLLPAGGAFAGMLYLLLSVEVFKLVTGPSVAALRGQGTVPAALALAKTAGAATRNVGLLVFAFVGFVALAAQLDAATGALTTCLPVLQQLPQAALVAVLLLGVLAAAFAITGAVRQWRRRATAARFTELAVLMLRHAHQMSEWAAGCRTTFESEEAQPFVSRRALRARVVEEMARAEPGMTKAGVAALYDHRVEPALLRRPNISQRTLGLGAAADDHDDGSGSGSATTAILQWIPPPGAAQPAATKPSLETARLARLKAAAAAAREGGGRIDLGTVARVS
jgi:hypothetical protein